MVAGEHATSRKFVNASVVLFIRPQTLSHQRFFWIVCRLRRKSTQTNFKLVQDQARLLRPLKLLFSLLGPGSIALRFSLVGLSSNTRVYKAVGARTIVRNTDLQRERAVTRLFRDVTVELYARFQSLLPLYHRVGRLYK